MRIADVGRWTLRALKIALTPFGDRVVEHTAAQVRARFMADAAQARS